MHATLELRAFFEQKRVIALDAALMSGPLQQFEGRTLSAVVLTDCCRRPGFTSVPMWHHFEGTHAWQWHHQCLYNALSMKCRGSCVWQTPRQQGGLLLRKMILCTTKTFRL